MRVTLVYPTHTATFEISLETAEKLQAYYNMDQFERMIVKEGRYIHGAEERGIFLKINGDVDSITEFLDDLAVEVVS